jgi:rubrerythrin
MLWQREGRVADSVLALLEASRKREKAQTRFYRVLAARAESNGEDGLVDRFNDLHADEQHHLSKLTARMLELGASLADAESEVTPLPELDGWEDLVRSREEAEVAWYEASLEEELDPSTRKLLLEILESEKSHARELGGKWMSA